MSEPMRYNEETGTYEAKKPLRARIRGKLSEYAESRREERAFKKGVKAKAKAEERESYAAGFIAGKKKSAYEKGKKEGAGGHGGIFGALEKAGKHVEIGPRKGKRGEQDFALGFSTPRASDFDIGLGMGSGKNHKKRDPYSELGL